MRARRPATTFRRRRDAARHPATMIRTLALFTLLAGFALGALAQLGEAPELVPWSFGAALAALVLWLAGAVIDARTSRGEPEGGAFDPGPAAWDSHPGTKEAARGDTGAADGDDA
jgi:hypothetical protein